MAASLVNATASAIVSTSASAPVYTEETNWGKDRELKMAAQEELLSGNHSRMYFDRLFRKYGSFMEKAAKNYAFSKGNRYFDEEDCLAACGLGFSNGVRTYDPRKGNWTSWLSLHMRDQMRTEYHSVLSEHGINGTMRKDMCKVMAVKDAAEAEGRTASTEELARACGKSVEEYVDFVDEWNMASHIEELDAPFGDEDDATLCDMLAVNVDYEREIGLSADQKFELVKGNLPELDRAILELKMEGAKRSDIARAVGKTEKTVTNRCNVMYEVFRRGMAA